MRQFEPPAKASALQIVIILFVVLIFTRFGGLFSLPPAGISAFWPVNALLLAGAFLIPKRPAHVTLLLALPTYFLAEIWIGYPPVNAAVYSFANVTEVAIFLWLLHKKSIHTLTFDNIKELFLFLAFALLASPVGGGIGGFAAMLTGGDFGSILLRWSLADFFGYCLFATLVLSWSRWRHYFLLQRPGRLAEFVILLMALLLVATLSFGVLGLAVPFSAQFLLVPILLWAALRFGPPGGAFTTAVVACIAFFSATHGVGLFSVGSPDENVESLQIFFASLVVSVMTIASLNAERRKSFDVLRQEVAERKRAEQDLLLVRFALDNVREAVLLIDEDACFQFVNEGACRVLGYMHDELLEMRVADVDPDFPMQRWPEHWRQLKTEHSLLFEGRHRTKDGRIIPVEISANYFQYGDQEFNLALVRDITERKQAEEKMFRSEQRLRLHAELSPLGFLEWDENFCASEWNAACERIFGYTREEALGRHARDLILPVAVHNLVDGIYRDLMSQTCGQHSINENVTKDGRTIIVEWFNTTLINKDGKAIGVASICRDITELKQAEKERQLHAEFLANMDRVNRAIQSAGDLAAMMQDVLDEVLDIFGCDRAYLLYPCDPSAATFSVPMERARPEFPGVSGMENDIPVDSEVSDVMMSLLNSPGVLQFGPGTGRPLPESTAEHYGFKSFMSTALFPKNDKAWEFGIQQCSHVRTWTSEEEKLLQEIGRRLTDGLNSLLILRDLRESETRYQRMFDTANEGIWVQDENFVTTFVNEHMAKMLGYTADELIEHKVTEFMLDEDAADHVHKMEERRRNISDVYERRMRHKDGSDVWMLISATPVFDGDCFSGSFAMLTDITARKEVEQKLATSEQLFRTLIEHSPYYIARYDLGLRRIYVNPALQEQFSVPAVQTLGNTPSASSPLTNPERYTARIRQAIETTSECTDEFSYRKPDGEIRWVNSHFIPEFDPGGKIATVMVVSIDITERKRAQDELVLSEEKFSRAFYASPNLMAITRPEDGLIVDINESFCHFFGYKREECIGHNTAELQMWVNPKQRGEIVQKLKRTGSVLYEPVELRTKSGEIRSAIDSMVFISIDNQEYLLSVATDITERKQAEEALRIHKEHLEELVEQRTEELRLARDEAETANKAKSVFLANMSHELRTPLNAILGFSHIMQQDAGLNENQRETMNIINNSGEHLFKLINDVLEIAKIEAGKVQLQIATFDLHALVREVTDMMRLRAQQKGLQLELDQSSEFPRYITGDEARLRQILVNLVSNAVKFTEKGSVTIRLGVKNDVQHHLLLEVEDTGPGISEEDQQRLFKPFVQLPEGKMQVGTGLGLSIVQQFVKLMGGSINVESIPGTGSLFRVELPLAAAAEAAIVRLSDESYGEVTGLAPGQPLYRILVAEDQHDNQLLLARLMTSIGMEVKTADNGEECVRIFKEWKPDLIWMDRRMPVMDGVEATRRIRRMRGGKKVKIVAVTASAFKEQEPELRAAGMDDYIRKPFRFGEIYDSMARQLGIKFTYRSETPTPQVSHEKLTPEQLRAVSAEQRDELYAAVESLDRHRIDMAISLIASVDAELGRTLALLADEFDYPTILAAIDATGTAQ